MVLPVGFTAGRAGSAVQEATEWTWATSQSTTFTSFTEGSDGNLGVTDDGFFWFDGTDKGVRWQPITINESNGSVTFGTSQSIVTVSQSIPAYVKGDCDTHHACFWDLITGSIKVYRRANVGDTWSLASSGTENFGSSLGAVSCFTNPDDPTEGCAVVSETWRSSDTGRCWVWKTNGSLNGGAAIVNVGYGTDKFALSGTGYLLAGGDGDANTEAGEAKLYTYGTDEFNGTGISSAGPAWDADTSSYDRWGQNPYGNKYGVINLNRIIASFNQSDGKVVYHTTSGTTATQRGTRGVGNYKYNHCIDALNSFGTKHYFRFSGRYGSTVINRIMYFDSSDNTNGQINLGNTNTSTYGYVAAPNSDYYPQYGGISKSLRVWSGGRNIVVATS